MGSGAFLVEACRQLADALVEAWDVHGVRPEVPPDEVALLYAKRLIVQRCLYGVDRNELAAELGKLSLWLATLARDHEFTFLDHCIRHGDSLVGLDRRQIEALSWMREPAGRLDLMQTLLRDRLAEAERERARIRTALDNEPEDQQRLILRRAEQALADPTLVGDAIIAAFFSADRARPREEARLEVRGVVEQAGTGWQNRLRPALTALRASLPPVVPFHWPLEFPEVFDRDNPGFDAIVGNPPFAGKNTTIAVNAEHYLDWLQTLHEGAHGNSDIVAHFFRRAYGLLRDGGCLGLLATNTIRQGDTRATGLRPIRQAGATIYSARRRIKWPGEAAVAASVILISKADLPGPYHLDGRDVPVITAFLFHDGGDGDPRTLTSNENRCFAGSIVLGMGFTFDDTDKKGTANPISLMHELVEKDPRNAERIFPYIGGEEINDSPAHAHHRYVINFEDFPLARDPSLSAWLRSSDTQCEDMLRSGIVAADYPHPVAGDWPDLLRIVEEKVKPTRDQNNREARRRRWWLFGDRQPGLYAAIEQMDRVLVRSLTSAHFPCFVLKENKYVFDQTLIVYTLNSFSTLTSLASRCHEIWTHFFGSTLEDRGRYNIEDCFEKFPFSRGFESDRRLQSVGQEYYEFRAALMTEYEEGLTKIYNRFHDPDERSNSIAELRRLHDAIDRAVLDAYGWTDLRPTCEFELEWQDDEAENSRRRKKPWRYRWPEPIRDEILARLLSLNAERAMQERLIATDCTIAAGGN